MWCNKILSLKICFHYLPLNFFFFWLKLCSLKKIKKNLSLEIIPTFFLSLRIPRNRWIFFFFGENNRWIFNPYILIIKILNQKKLVLLLLLLNGKKKLVYQLSYSYSLSIHISLFVTFSMEAEFEELSYSFKYFLGPNFLPWLVAFIYYLFDTPLTRAHSPPKIHSSYYFMTCVSWGKINQ